MHDLGGSVVILQHRLHGVPVEADGGGVREEGGSEAGLNEAGSQLGDTPGEGVGESGVSVGRGVPLGGPEGKEGMGDLLDEKKMVHGATQMVHCFCNRGIGFGGYEDVIDSAGVLQSCISVLVIGV